MWHIVACFICILGLVLTVLSDTMQSDAQPAPQGPAWLGDARDAVVGVGLVAGSKERYRRGRKVALCRTRLCLLALPSLSSMPSSMPSWSFLSSMSSFLSQSKSLSLPMSSLLPSSSRGRHDCVRYRACCSPHSTCFGRRRSCLRCVRRSLEVDADVVVSVSVSGVGVVGVVDTVSVDVDVVVAARCEAIRVALDVIAWSFRIGFNEKAPVTSCDIAMVCVTSSDVRATKDTSPLSSRWSPWRSEASGDVAQTLSTVPCPWHF